MKNTVLKRLEPRMPRVSRSARKNAMTLTVMTDTTVNFTVNQSAFKKFRSVKAALKFSKPVNTALSTVVNLHSERYRPIANGMMKTAVKAISIGPKNIGEYFFSFLLFMFVCSCDYSFALSDFHSSVTRVTTSDQDLVPCAYCRSAAPKSFLNV